ncbi:MAG: esterase/lipase family protein [Egibacteraceae bacterium]
MRGRRHLVVVVPGIGGSVLACPGKPDDVVWDAGIGDLTDLVVHPDRMSTAESPCLEPIGLTKSTKLLGFTVVPGYERLLDQLEAFGKVDRRGDPKHPVRDADVVVVPYDFRRGIVEAAERLDAVVRGRQNEVSEAEQAARVIVVAHSLGGLVARYWMGMGPEPRWEWCRALITLGTPHRGASKALNWLVNGVRLCGARLSGPSELVWDWPVVAELLPRYPVVRNLAVPADQADGKWYPHQLPIDRLAGPAEKAYDLHVDIERAWWQMPRDGPEMVACMGWSHPTLDACCWDGASLEVKKEPPDWLDLSPRWKQDFGDGTVPAYSALPPELDNHTHSPIRLTDRHVPMACSERILELIMDSEGGGSLKRVLRGMAGERAPALGLDVEELHAAGQPIPVTATIREAEADLAGQAVWARLRPAAEGAGALTAGRVDARLDWDSERGRFQGVLPGQPEGLYQLEVKAREVPHGGDLETADTVAVIDGG